LLHAEFQVEEVVSRSGRFVLPTSGNFVPGVFYEKVFPKSEGFAGRDYCKVGDPQEKSDGQ